MSAVYFVHAPSVNLVKIGRSADPERRFGELRLISPVPLEILAIVPGGSTAEAEFHRRFASLRSHGEWFHGTKELLRFAWNAQMDAWWNRAPQEWRNEFMARTDAAVFDRSACGSEASAA